VELNSIHVKMVLMVIDKRRRTDALSKDRIVLAAIQTLDAEGDSAQFFKALTTRLSTGAGAIYHHVANKNELLAAAADTIISAAVTSTGADPRHTIRELSLGIYDAIDAHPWVGGQLSREPWQPAVLHIWEALGAQLGALGLSGEARSDAGSALVNYVLGAAAQQAAGAGTLHSDEDRTAFLETLATRWEQLDPAEHPLAGDLAAGLREHDDRAQFLAGVEIFLAGITA
jgi:AcrR family transcriptional regulator